VEEKVLPVVEYPLLPKIEYVAPAGAPFDVDPEALTVTALTEIDPVVGHEPQSPHVPQASPNPD